MQGQMIGWNASASALRNSAPVILSGEVLGRLRKVFSISVEQRDSESDDGVIAIVHFEGQADKAVAVVVDKAADLHGVGSGRSDHDFSQVDVLRGGSAQAATITEGGVAASPVLNSRCRTARGSAGKGR